MILYHTYYLLIIYVFYFILELGFSFISLFNESKFRLTDQETKPTTSKALIQIQILTHHGS